jgi:diaminopimelate epimerase
MRLSKLHATGNDFLVRVADDPDDHLDRLTVAALCDRHRGVGADGLITIGSGGPDHDCSMLLQNADGGVAEMSGNGIRCLAYVAARDGRSRGDVLRVATGAGRRDVFLERDDTATIVAAEVDMGAARFGEPLTLDLDGERHVADVVDMGNPHLVFVVPDPEAIDVARHGPHFEHLATFTQRTNVEFGVARDRTTAAMRVWERGVGETMSCGTGVCATAAVLHRRGFVDADLSMHVRGGVLRVHIGDTIRLAGPVVHVFDVDLDRERLLANLS